VHHAVPLPLLLPTDGRATLQIGAFKDRGQPEPEAESSSEEDEGPRENKGTRRAKGESKEEKAARKQAVKDERRVRRATKKATTEAFGKEERRQVKIIDNMRRNLGGMAL